MNNRSINRARKRRTPGRPELNALLRVYLRKFPRAVRRELKSDPRKRSLSIVASRIKDRSAFSRSLDQKRAKLVVQFDDGTPAMPVLLPGMKWRMWESQMPHEPLQSDGNEPLVLTERESLRLLEMIENPPPRSEKFMDAMDKYQKSVIKEEGEITHMDWTPDGKKNES